MNWVLGAIVVLLSAALAYGGEIRVRVSNAHGEAVAGAQVTAVSSARRGRREVRKEGSTGTDGAHTITGLEPGAYTVMVFVPSERGSLRRPVVLRSEASSVEVDFRFPPARQPRSTDE